MPRRFIEGSIEVIGARTDGDDLAQRCCKAIVAAGLAESVEIEWERATPND